MRTWFQQSFPTIGEWDFSLRLLLRFRCQVAATLEEAQGVRPHCGAKVGMASSAALLLVIVDLDLKDTWSHFPLKHLWHLCLRDVIKMPGYTRQRATLKVPAVSRGNRPSTSHAGMGALCPTVTAQFVSPTGTCLEHVTQGHISAVGSLPCSRRNTVPCTCRPSA